MQIGWNWPDVEHVLQQQQQQQHPQPVRYQISFDSSNGKWTACVYHFFLDTTAKEMHVLPLPMSQFNRNQSLIYLVFGRGGKHVNRCGRWQMKMVDLCNCEVQFAGSILFRLHLSGVDYQILEKGIVWVRSGNYVCGFCNDSLLPKWWPSRDEQPSTGPWDIIPLNMSLITMLWTTSVCSR